LRDRLVRTGEIVPDVVVASTLLRAVETAEIVGAAFPDLELTTHDDYREQDVGASDGLSLAEHEARYGKIDDTDPDKDFAPGGESPRAFDVRVAAAVAALVAATADQTVMVFTHGGFVTAATLHLLGAPGAHSRGSFWVPPRNTSLNILVSDRSVQGWALERYNDAVHLDDG
jgi:broad specificity phosphatase PhoE